MNAKILDGKKLAREILDQLQKVVPHRKLQLAVVHVGENPVSEKYIGEKQKVAEMLGVTFRAYYFPETISLQKLQESIRKIGKDTRNTALIIQLPLPPDYHTQEVLNSIPVEKDVDVLSSLSFGLFALGRFPILPPTVGAVSLLLNKYKIKVEGKHVVLVGAGRLVGLPLTLWFLQHRATVTVAHKYTKHVSLLTKQADILVSGAGKPDLIRASMVKKGAVVIDAGSSVEHGKVVGDADFSSVAKKAAYLTPVPGGVGPLTVALLFANLFLLSKLMSSRKTPKTSAL